MKKNWSVGDLLSTSSAYWKGCALQAGVRLGVFTALNEERLHLDEVAEKINADPRGTEYLMNALAAMGLLEKDERGYRNAPDARLTQALTVSSPLRRKPG